MYHCHISRTMIVNIFIGHLKPRLQPIASQWKASHRKNYIAHIYTSYYINFNILRAIQRNPLESLALQLHQRKFVFVELPILPEILTFFSSWFLFLLPLLQIFIHIQPLFIFYKYSSDFYIFTSFFYACTIISLNLCTTSLNFPTLFSKFLPNILQFQQKFSIFHCKSQ